MLLEDENLIADEYNSLIEDDPAELLDDLQGIISTVRKICCQFRRPKFSRALKKYTKNCLKIDCKTRLSSMFQMD